jgi:hypothetical protein
MTSDLILTYLVDKSAIDMCAAVSSFDDRFHNNNKVIKQDYAAVLRLAN